MLKATYSRKMAKKFAAGLLGAATATGLGITFALNADLVASGGGCQTAKYPWFHSGIFHTLDHASVRRGYEVYKQVCAACHSMNHTYYRHLVGVSHTEDEVKAEAAEVQVVDGPNDDGEMYERPGKLSDHLPNPYPNDEAAKKANNNALPPDLSLIAFARKGGADYIYSLLTGFQEPPAGVEEKENLHYNPYFNGSWISMKAPLYDEIIEYSDGTPATVSQMSKDVTEFLRWSAEKSHDDKKKLLLKTFLVFPPILALFYIYKRRVFTVLKSRKIFFNPPKETKH